MEPSVVALIDLIRRFVAGEMDAQTFDIEYRAAFMQLPLLGEPLFPILDRLAIECVEYIDVPELREPGDIGDEELTEAARKTLADLRELGVA